MIISDETVVLFLLLGVVLGAFFTVNQAIIAMFSIKKPGIFLLDFTFAAVCCVVTFIGTLAAAGGRLRLIPVLLELVGGLSFYFAAGDGLVWLIRRIKRGLTRRVFPPVKRWAAAVQKGLSGRFSAKKANISQKATKGAKKTAKKTKKVPVRLEKPGKNAL